MLTTQDMSQLKEVFVTKEEHDSAFNFLSTQIMATQSSVEHLESRMDEKFDAIDSKFDAIDTKFDHIDKKFDSIDRKFAAVDARFEVMDEKFDAMDEKMDRVLVTLDAIAGGVQDLRLDSAISSAQYNRQMEWNQKVAKKIDVPFD